MTDPRTREEGEELSRACSRRAELLAAGIAADNDVWPNGDEKLWLEIGIAAGMAATMQELIDRGVIDGDRAV